MARFAHRLGVVVLGLSLAGCGGGSGAGGEGGAGAMASAGAESSTPASTREREVLAFVREEEKLARDVYGALLSLDPVFTNIQRSEQTHMDAVLVLLERLAIPDPAAGAPPGAFQDARLQGLYDELVARGAASHLAALAVGVEIEELDIHDIEGMRAATTRTDVLTTLDNLTRGSRNHLRSFHARLTSLGGSYTPRHLDAAEFEAIVGSEMETGSPWR